MLVLSLFTGIIFYKWWVNNALFKINSEMHFFNSKGDFTDDSNLEQIMRQESNLNLLPGWEIWNTIFYIIIPCYAWFFITGRFQVLPGQNCSSRTRFVSLDCIYLQCEPFHQSQSPSVPSMSLHGFKTEFCLVLDVFCKVSWITTYKCPFLPTGSKKALGTGSAADICTATLSCWSDLWLLSPMIAILMVWGEMCQNIQWH